MEELIKQIQSDYLSLYNLEFVRKKMGPIDEYAMKRKNLELNLKKHLREWYKRHEEDPELGRIAEIVKTQNIKIYKKKDL